MSKTMNKLKNDEVKYKEVNLFKNPKITIKTILIILAEQVIKFVNFIISRKLLMMMVLVYIVLNFFEGMHNQYLSVFNKIFYFCGYWILLGVASSIGLGTGLHTFVLYLGPHIAKVTLAANECSFLPEMHPNKWEFKDFLPCTEPSTESLQVSFFTILLHVQLEAFMWGLGTALGELPPYFMAKAAAEAGKSSEVMEELRKLEKNKPTGFMEKIKSYVYQHLQKHGFITVLICASIPNPLFDLAGITCGHFGIPFATFFGATFIGKSLIKVSLQSMFVIFTFSKRYVEVLLEVIENNVPFLKKTLTENMDKQKKLLWFNQDDMNITNNGKPIIATLWEIFISFMIIYFLISIINSVVNDKRKSEFEKNKKNN